MNLSRFLPALLLVSALLPACDDDDPEPTPDAAPPTSTLRETWDEQCDRFMACPEMRDATSCKTSFPCLEALLRPDALAASVACHAERACGTRDDACLDPAALGFEGDQAAASLRTECLAKRTGCDAGSESFSDDYCFVAPIARGAIVDALAACLTSECAVVEGCMDGVIAAAHPSCDEN